MALASKMTTTHNSPGARKPDPVFMSSFTRARTFFVSFVPTVPRTGTGLTCNGCRVRNVTVNAFCQISFSGSSLTFPAWIGIVTHWFDRLAGFIADSAAFFRAGGIMRVFCSSLVSPIKLITDDNTLEARQYSLKSFLFQDRNCAVNSSPFRI